MGGILDMEDEEEEDEDDAGNSENSYQVDTPRERRPRRAKAVARFLAGGYDEDDQDPLVDIEGEGGDEEPKDFEIEKSQGLKLTLKKSSQPLKKEPRPLPEISRVRLTTAKAMPLYRL